MSTTDTVMLIPAPSDVVFLPLIHPSSPSYYLFAPPLPSPSPTPCHCSKPSTVTMDPSKTCLKARGSERQSLCLRAIVFAGEEERGRGRREGKGESCPVQYREAPPQQ